MSNHLVGVLALFATLAMTESVASDAGASVHCERAGQQLIGLRYGESDTQDFLKAILTSMNIQHFERTDSEGITVFWCSSSSTEEREIRNRVSQYTFIKEVCRDLPLPASSESAKEQLSCEH